MTKQIVVEKGVPLPGSRGHENPYKEVLETMNVGESFVAEGERSGSVSGAANSSLKPKKFTSRKVEGGHRVWRAE
jgi:hypothetical protein